MMQTDKEYAEALFSLAVEEGKVNDFTIPLSTIKELVTGQPEYIELLASPAIPLAERISVIDDAFGCMPEYVVSFVKLLCENGHIRLLEDCINEYNKLVLLLSDRASVTVYSAIPLDSEQKQAICLKLKKVIGKEIDAEYLVDESLIGGLKIEAEGKTYDGSVKRKLLDVKDVVIG